MKGCEDIKTLAVEIMLSGAFLAILEMLIPNGKTEKVVSFAVSLVLLVLLLSPLESAMNINQEDFTVSMKSELKDEVKSALEEGEKMFSDMVEGSSIGNIRSATIEALMTVGIEIDSQDVQVETNVNKDTVTIKVLTINFDENEMNIIEENKLDLEVNIGTNIAQRLRLDRNMIRLYFEI